MGSREASRKTDQAIVVSMHPDVCSKDDKPTPYDIHAIAVDDVKPSYSVLFTGEWAMHEGARLSTCHGNGEADAGIESGCVEGYCRPDDKFANWVRVNSKRVVRHDTVFEMNCKGPEGSSNTKGKLVYRGPLPKILIQRAPILMTDDAKKAFEKARQETLEKLREHVDDPDFYKYVGEFDWMNEDLWDQMVEIQNNFRAAELGYFDPDLITYSESVRETLHGAVIGLFEDSDALSVVTASGPTGLYDWYLQMHWTAFAENGAFNPDFLLKGVQVLFHTDPRMAKNIGQVAGTGREAVDPYAAEAAAHVRELRDEAGVTITSRRGEPLQPKSNDPALLDFHLTWDRPCE